MLGTAGDDHNTGSITLAARTSHPATVGKKLNPGYFGCFHSQTIFCGLVHHLRSELRTGDTVGKSGIILYQLHILDIPAEAILIQK